MITLPSRPARMVLLIACCAAVALPAGAADDGLVKCRISENSRSATGTMVLERGGRAVAEGSCGGTALRVPAGEYTAVLGLDGALDAPEKRRQVTVAAGQSTEVRADFATGLLQLEFTRDGKPAAGMAEIRQGAKRIGTLSSGVQAHLSAGRYELTARYRSQRKELGTITITAGDRKTLQVAF